MEGERTDIDGYGDGAPGGGDYPNVTEGNMEEDESETEDDGDDGDDGDEE